MHKPPQLSEPAFAKILQDALRRGGQVLVVEPPAPPLPPPRERNEPELVAACCTLFDLTAREGLVLAKLMCADYQTLQVLRDAAAPKRTPDSMRTFLIELRKKLAPHELTIKNGHRIGYYLPKIARDNIYNQLAQHDARSVSKRRPAQARAASP
jgi:hypothetical protein